MTFNEFVLLVAKEQTPDERIGQRGFNLLAAHQPELTDRVRGGDSDPFFFDSRLPKFHAFLAENWP